MLFDDGSARYSLPELKTLLGHLPDGLRLTGSWHDPSSTNTDSPRCIARLLADGRLQITDFIDGVRHYEPVEGSDTIVDAFALLPQPIQTGEEAPEDPAPVPRLSAGERAEQLVDEYVYCRTRKQSVISIRNPSTDQSTQSNFLTDMGKYSDPPVMVNGKQVVYHPGKIWMNHPDRVSVVGMQMRPDQRMALFRENGDIWLNTYRPPIHGQHTGGDAMVGRAWLRQIAPDPAERKYFTQWLAYKLRHPHVPGPAIIMVANNRFGTGRTTFARLIALIFGDAYVRNVPFHIVSGKSYQSQYNDWASSSLFVVVTETQETQGLSPYRMKHDTYNHLKELVEVHPHRREVIRQGVIAEQVWCFLSLLILTNDFDAVPLPGADRRFFVLEGGIMRRPAFWDVVNRWMQDPANVAAFVDWLMEIDLSDYSPYAPPPVTEAKRVMAEASESDLDRYTASVLARLQRRQSELFSAKHLIDGIMYEHNEDGVGSDLPQNWRRIVLDKILPKHGVHRIGIPRGRNWDTKLKDGKRYATYAWTKALAKKWTTEDWERIRTELLKAGSLETGVGIAGLHLVGRLDSED